MMSLYKRHKQNMPLRVAHQTNIKELLSVMLITNYEILLLQRLFPPFLCRSSLPFFQCRSFHFRNKIKNVAVSGVQHFNHFSSGVEIKVPLRAPKILSSSASHLNGACVSRQQWQKESMQLSSIIICSFAL